MSEVKAISQVAIDAFAINNNSIMHLINSADFISKMVMLTLVILSIWSWSILFDKYIKYKTINKKIQKFEESFWSGQLLDQLYDRLRYQADQPLVLIFVAAINEWKKNNYTKTGSDSNFVSHELTNGLKDRVLQAMELVRNKELAKIEEGLSVLATVSSAAPFIGLFGTVWGIMNSFQSIAVSKNTSLAVVAPGIAEALLATAIGLFAAIPAVIFYNYLTTHFIRISNKADDFILELYTLISRSIDDAIYSNYNKVS